MGFTEGEYSERLGGTVVRITEHWIVAVCPMLVNTRITITDRSAPTSFTAGWCYPGRNNPAAYYAAVAWDPETELEPQDYVKVAYDERRGSLL